MGRKIETEKITRGSGNVFRDLGFKNADEMLAKADLVIAISRVMSARKLTQAKLAAVVGIDQPSVSRLLRGHTEGYTTDRLMKILNKLGQDVEITVRPKAATRAKSGKIYVVKPAVAPVAAREPKGKYSAKK